VKLTTHLAEAKECVDLYLHPLPQYDFMAWCSVTAQGQLYLYLVFLLIKGSTLISANALK